MGLEVAVFSFFVFFQLAGAAALFPQKLHGRRAPAILLSALLVLNAVLSVVDLLRVLTPHPTLNVILLAVDAPTWGVLFAFLALRRDKRGLAGGALALGLLLALLTVVVPSFFTSSRFVIPFIQVPYYVALLAITWDLSAGSAEDRWIATAFLARPFFFALQTIPVVTDQPTQPYEQGLFLLNDGALVICALGHALAAYRMVHPRARVANGPPAALVVGVVLLGATDGVVYETLAAMGVESLVAFRALNYLTLAFTRPLFLYRALVPSRTTRLVADAAFTSGVAAAVYAGAILLGYPLAPAVVLAFALGVFVLLLLEHFRPHGEVSGPHAGSAERALRFLWVLRHSREGPPLLSWTQKEVAAAIEAPVQRVSEMPRRLNDRAKDWLDTYVPEWRLRWPSAPDLVSVHRGLVMGESGVRLYYRLTEAGEAVARSEKLLTQLKSDPPRLVLREEENVKNIRTR